MVRKHRREGPKWTDIAIVFLTIGIVFLAFMQHKDLVDAGIQTDRIICADERLAKAMEDSVSQAQKSFDAANKQASLTERAWAIARPRLPEPTIVNIGRTPAFEVTALGMLYVSQGPIPDIAKWIESQKDPFGKEKAYIGVLFPGQPMGAHLPGISTGSSPNADPEIRNGRKMVYLILQVDYFTLDVHHISRSCGVWIPDASGFDPGKGCRTWNYVD